jgi:glycerol-3-phosphate acyltransferase PlsY
MVEFDFGANWWQFVLIAIGGYFVGCFNFAVLIAKLKKRDVTKIGSGNPGSMNMTREFGPVVGFTNFFLDTFKAGIPALIVYYSYANAEFAGTNFCVGWFAAFLCGLFVVVGHVFPVTMKFKAARAWRRG